MKQVEVAIEISANIEWQIVLEMFTEFEPKDSPLGQWFFANLHAVTDFGLPSKERHRLNKTEPVLFYHGGWGKIAAAASTQYIIDRWSPQLLINLGTCGGFKGKVDPETVILAERTIVYDIIEQIYDADDHVAHYITDLNLSWLRQPYPHEVRQTVLISADRDIIAGQVDELITQYGAVAADWESGAIAWTANRNKTHCLILRGVSDLVDHQGGEAYIDKQVFIDGTKRVMTKLLKALPGWILCAIP